MAKQDPFEKAQRSAYSDGKVYFSYAQIHNTICRLVPEIKAFAPDVIVAIGGGGYIPARSRVDFIFKFFKRSNSMIFTLFL